MPMAQSKYRRRIDNWPTRLNYPPRPGKPPFHSATPELLQLLTPALELSRPQ